jgi:hypothetical protein
MTIVTSYDWESETWTHSSDNPDRKAWRDAVAEIADKAKARLPECNSRVDKALVLVFNGDVELLPDGTAKVASQSNGTTAYVVCNGTCECKDFPKAPSGWCKHRIAAGMQKRATALMQRKHSETCNGHAETPSQPAQPAAPTVPLPEAPVSITLKAALHGHEVMVTLRGVDFASVKAQVEDASQWLQAQRGHTADTTPQCPTHGAMKLSTKGKGWYCPHKLADGSWCKGK